MWNKIVAELSALASYYSFKMFNRSIYFLTEIKGLVLLKN